MAQMRRLAFRRPLSPDSSDEATDHSNVEQDGQSNSSLVCPSSGSQWRDSSAKTAFGPFGSGSGSFAEQATSKVNAFNGAERVLNNTSRNALPAVPVQHTMNTILPTKVRLHARSQISDERSSFQTPLTVPAQSTMSNILPTKIRFPGNDQVHRQVSLNKSTAQMQTGIALSKLADPAPNNSANATPPSQNDANEVSGYTSSQPTCITTAQPPPDSETPSIGNTSQDASCPDLSTVASVKSPQALPNTLHPNNGTATTNMASPAAYPSSTGTVSSTPTPTKSSRTVDAVTATLLTAHQRKTSNSAAESVQAQESSLDHELEDKDVPQDSVRGKKKRGKTQKAQVRKKRGDWRVENYVNSSFAAASPDPSQPQFYFSGAHQPAFKASDPITTTTVLSAPFLPSEIASALIHAGDVTKSSRTVNASTGPSDPITHDLISSSLHDSISSPVFDDMIDDGLDSGYPIDNERHTPVPSSCSDHQSLSHDSANNDQQYPSHNSRSRESPVTKSWPGMLQSNKDRTSKATNPVEPPRKEPTTARRLAVAGLPPSTTPEPMHSEQVLSSTTPNSCLMNVVIEDTRMDWDEPSLVEMMVPLRRAENDTFWADAVDVLRKYTIFAVDTEFISFACRRKNVDNYVSANLSIPADRTLHVYVESIITPALSRTETSSTPLYQTRTSYSPVSSTHLASPAPSGSPDYYHASLPDVSGSYTPHPLKRNRDGKTSRRNVTETASDPSIAGAPSKRKKEDCLQSSGQYYRS
ncbi:hypothetical protein EW145_g3968 [Phellinidium pouzarii]|uniref:Uncharacterized protein n=1 Tax=Phellinidium pouzarii TaxID=167371 RepID=A0A4S4L5G5_9AGAM|nr:hypothetical protein EW145_g3968 [Phellinidium pouzarii]